MLLKIHIFDYNNTRTNITGGIPMILSCQNICKSFGEKVILEDASFHIEDREKAALIGNNGAGKTTLLRIIMREISPDSGNVILAKDKNIGYLAQYQDIHGHHTIYEELISTKQHILIWRTVCAPWSRK